MNENELVKVHTCGSADALPSNNIHVCYLDVSHIVCYMCFHTLLLGRAVRKPFCATVPPSCLRNRDDCDWLTTRQEASATFRQGFDASKEEIKCCLRNVSWTGHPFHHLSLASSLLGQEG